MHLRREHAMIEAKFRFYTDTLRLFSGKDKVRSSQGLERISRNMSANALLNTEMSKEMLMIFKVVRE